MNMPSAEERLRVNMGFQCPECFGVDINTPPRVAHVADKHECQCCGCKWDRHYYPALVVRAVR